MMKPPVHHPDVGRFKERVRNAREQEILSAARDVFAEQGFDDASIDEIAERVGIGKGTVYLHFPSKLDILAALMHQMATDVATRSCERMTACPNALAKLRVVMEVLIEHQFAHQPIMRICAAESPHFLGHGRQPVPGQVLRDLIGGLIEEGKAGGLIDGRIDTNVAAKALPHLVFATAYEPEPKPKRSKQRVLESVEQMYFHGITKEGQA
jgi:TetR/AcrR family transcriptional regulator, fatty acid metabolism regulator protein